MSFLQSPKGSFAYFDLVVVLLAMVANCVVLVAVVRGQFGHQMVYRRFLISLATCDLFSCVVNLITMTYQIYMMAYGFQLPPFFKCGANILKSLQLAGFFTNLLNLCAMSLDHFFGVVFTVQYRQLMNDHISRMTIVSIWFLSFTMASLDIPINIILYRDTHMAVATVVPENPTSSQASSEMALPFMPTINENPALSHFNDAGLRAVQFSDGRRPPFLFVSRERRSSSKNRKPNSSLSKTADSAINGRSSSTGNGSRHTNSVSGTSSTSSKKNGGNKLYINNATKVASKGNLTTTTISRPTSLSNEAEDDGVESSSNGRTAEDQQMMLSRILMQLREDEERQRRRETEGASDFCTFFSVKKFWFEMCVFCLVAVCFSMLILCYGIIFKRVTSKFDSSGKRTKRLAVTTVIFLGAFAVCWLPFMIYEFALLIIFHNNQVNGQPATNDNSQGSTGLTSFIISNFGAYCPCCRILATTMVRNRRNLGQASLGSTRVNNGANCRSSSSSLLHRTKQTNGQNMPLSNYDESKCNQLSAPVQDKESSAITSCYIFSGVTSNNDVTKQELPSYAEKEAEYV